MTSYNIKHNNSVYNTGNVPFTASMLLAEGNSACKNQEWPRVPNTRISAACTGISVYQCCIGHRRRCMVRVRL